MIAQLTGECVAFDAERVVLDVHGVGYAVRATSSVLEQAAAGTSPLRVHTYLQVREDALQLWGFSSPVEREVFERLLALQGVGPKVALSIVSSYDADTIRRATQAEDVALFTSIPGIGPKVARRIVTELSGKLDDIGGGLVAGAQVGEDSFSSYMQAREALVELGLSVAQAEHALRESDDDAPVGERVKAALKVVHS